MQSEQEDFLAMGLKAQTPAMEPTKLPSLEEEINTRVSKIRALPDSERRRSIGELRSRMETHKRNIANGYDDHAELNKLQEIVNRSMTVQERMWGTVL